MSSVKVFEHPVFGQLEIIDQNGDPWFVATRVAQMLGYVDPAGAVRKHCKKVNKISMANLATPINIIPESDVHRLIMRSKLERAEEIQDWVCGEVLPDIRKHGFYGTDRFVEMVMADPLAMSRFFQEYHFEKERRVLAERQRDEAVATKAWIGEKKVATAMNTASHLSKENERLLVQIGDSTNWKTVKAVGWLREGRSKCVA